MKILTKQQAMEYFSSIGTIVRDKDNEAQYRIEVKVEPDVFLIREDRLIEEANSMLEHQEEINSPDFDPYNYEDY